MTPRENGAALDGDQVKRVQVVVRPEPRKAL